MCTVLLFQYALFNIASTSRSPGPWIGMVMQTEIYAICMISGVNLCTDQLFTEYDGKFRDFGQIQYRAYEVFTDMCCKAIL